MKVPNSSKHELVIPLKSAVPDSMKFLAARYLKQHWNIFNTEFEINPITLLNLTDASYTSFFPLIDVPKMQIFILFQFSVPPFFPAKVSEQKL